MRKFSVFALCVSLALSVCAMPAFAVRTEYPVTIDNGIRNVTFEAAPQRVVTNCDSNIIELMFALGLEDRLVGYAGFAASGKQVSPQYREKLEKIPVADPGYISLEPLLAMNPDFFLSGYYYGLDIPGDTGASITPDELEKHGVKSYAITESLVRVMEKPPVSLEDTYNDLTNLGIIFDVQDRAAEVISGMRAHVADVEGRLKDIKEPLSVFICRSTGTAEDAQWGSCGAQAMPSCLIRMANAVNAFEDVKDSWIKVNVEDVVARDPDVILILEYARGSGEARRQFIMQSPLMQGLKAVRNNRVFVTVVENVYPGPRAVDGFEIIAGYLYPELF